VLLLVISNDLDIGGAQNYTIGLMNEFVKMGHTVSLRVLSDNLLLKDRLNGEIEMKVWPRKSILDFNILSKIRKEVKQREFDGIISSYDIYQKLSTFLLNNNPTTIYPIHSTIEKEKKIFIFNYFLYRLKRKNEIYLTSIDDQTKYLIAAYKLKNNFFQQIYNGIDIEKFILPPVSFDKNDFLKKIGINPKHRIILMVAGYREEKRHIDAINAFKILQKELDNVSLVFAGDSRIKERDELQQYIDLNNIENIKLLLASEAGDIRNFYWSSDVFTLTSNKVETFPISALEAMASGLPCVLTNIGGAKDFIIQNVNGILCKANNILDIKNKWAHVLGHYDQYNKNTIRNIVVEKYSIARAANEYLQLIAKKNKREC